jgi:hypothetical protein
LVEALRDLPAGAKQAPRDRPLAHAQRAGGLAVEQGRRHRRRRARREIEMGLSSNVICVRSRRAGSSPGSIAVQPRGRAFQPDSGGVEDHVVHAAGAAVELKRGDGDEGADQQQSMSIARALQMASMRARPGMADSALSQTSRRKHAIASSKAPSRSSALEPKCPITPGWPRRSWDGHLADLLSVCPVGDVRRKQGQRGTAVRRLHRPPQPMTAGRTRTQSPAVTQWASKSPPSGGHDAALIRWMRVRENKGGHACTLAGSVQVRYR